jgi:FixJ family two-component response regulator
MYLKPGLMNESAASRGMVLVADDDDTIRSGLVELLRRKGYAASGVASGAEALVRLAEAHFEVLVSDIHMPGNAGLELVQSVAQMAPLLAVVLLTGQPSVETAARSVRLPVAAYLTKPPNLDELCSILDDAVAGYRSRRVMQSGRERLQTWEKEIEHLERTLRAMPPGEVGGPVGSYLRLTLRQVMLMLADLEQAAIVLEKPTSSGALASVDREAALRRTVDVLERTKQNFKSKDLADLRRQLEQLLRRTTAGE